MIWDTRFPHNYRAENLGSCRAPFRIITACSRAFDYYERTERCCPCSSVAV
jgi:hypothetical protein